MGPLRRSAAPAAGALTVARSARHASASFSARVVESPDAPWLPMGEAVSDPGVALDMARSLTSRAGASVIRVSPTPGSRLFRESAGDWLCDPSSRTGGENELIRRSPWGCCPEASRWSRGMEQLDAWLTCPQPSWAVQQCLRVGVPTVRLIGAAAEAARPACESARDPRPLAALDAVEAWLAGGAPPRISDLLPASRTLFEMSAELRVRDDDSSEEDRFALDCAWDVMGVAKDVAHLRSGAQSPSTYDYGFRTAESLSRVIITTSLTTGIAEAAEAVRRRVMPIDFLRAHVRRQAGVEPSEPWLLP